MTTKTFCDFCKEEIENLTILEVKTNRGLVIQSLDLCESCLQSFELFVRVKQGEPI